MKGTIGNRLMLGAASVITSVILGMSAWGWLFYQPCRLETDCRGCAVEAATLKRWEEQEKDGYLGILDMAGWRLLARQPVSSISTGRRKNCRIIGVYGNMQLVYPEKLLSGSYGIAGKEDCCVISEGLADALFGSADVAGELVRADGKILRIAGVIEKEEPVLMMPVSDGAIEQIAVTMDSRFQAEKRFSQLLEGR